MLNVNTTKITIVGETRECLSRQMMLKHFLSIAILRFHSLMRFCFYLLSLSIRAEANNCYYVLCECMTVESIHQSAYALAPPNVLRNRSLSYHVRHN